MLLTIRKNIFPHSYGGEYFANYYLGFGGYKNKWNKGGPVPIFAFLPPPTKFMDMRPRIWGNIDSEYTGLNQHGFIKNYYEAFLGAYVRVRAGNGYSHSKAIATYKSLLEASKLCIPM